MTDVCFFITALGAWTAAAFGLFLIISGACGAGDEDSGLVVLLGFAMLIVGASAIFTLSRLMS